MRRRGGDLSGGKFHEYTIGRAGRSLKPSEGDVPRAVFACAAPTMGAPGIDRPRRKRVDGFCRRCLHEQGSHCS
jgi:hypothetical protein